MQSAYAVLQYYLWPVRLYNIFHIISYMTRFSGGGGEIVTERKCVLCIYYIIKNLLYYIVLCCVVLSKMYVGLYVSSCGPVTGMEWPRGFQEI
jgi:hypothetical protein